MKETTDTSYSIFPQGHYRFTVKGGVEKIRSKNDKPMYKWRFYVHTPQGMKGYKETILVGFCGPLLRALGCEEVKRNVFEWDREAVDGLQFDADIVHEKDKNDPDKFWPRLKNPTPLGGKVEEEPPDIPPVAEDDIPF